MASMFDAESARSSSSSRPAESIRQQSHQSQYQQRRQLRSCLKPRAGASVPTGSSSSAAQEHLSGPGGGGALPLPHKPRLGWREDPSTDVRGCSPASTLSWQTSSTASPSGSRSSSLGRSSLPSMSFAPTPSGGFSSAAGSSTRLPEIVTPPPSPARQGLNTPPNKSKNGAMLESLSQQQPSASGQSAVLAAAAAAASATMTGTVSANSSLSNFAARLRSAVASPMGSPTFRQLRERLSTKSKKSSVTAAAAPHPELQTEEPAAKLKEYQSSLFRKLEEGERLETCYRITGEIYCVGNRCKVMSAVRKADDLQVVVKIRTKSSSRNHDRTWRKIMDKVASLGGRSHVLGLVEIIEDQDEYFVVMPNCEGGELFNFLASESEIAESECQRIIREILLGIGHLHKRNIMHRDLKPENIMFAQKGSKSLQLIDFDTCMEYTPRSPTAPRSSSFVGTPGYIAPEALLGDPSPKSDLWSIGVIMYILMTGEMPWSRIVSLKEGRVGSPEARQMYASIQTQGIRWKAEPWKTFPEAADLCQRLLAFRTEDRIASAKDALAHPWLSGVA